MESIKLKAYAKVNLSLDILGKRDNGYHEVEMIMQQITLHDDVMIKKIDQGLTIHTNCHYVPDDERNIAYKVASKIIEKYSITSGVHIEIDKKIPVAAGLAGGSADAAAVVKGLNQLFELNMSLEEMKAIGVMYGADIPFCIAGGASVARGIGEVLEDIPSLKRVWMVLVKPPIGVSTASIYKALDVNHIQKHPDTQKLIGGMYDNDFRMVSECMYNVLEEVTSKKYSVIQEIESKMREYGALGSMMSGSGPTVFGIYKNYKKAEDAFKNLKRKHKEVFLVQTYDGGNHE